MAKEYWLKFDSGLPSTLGLSPTFIVFKSWTGGVVSPPGITQQLASYGLYRFEFTPSFPIVFVCDGATSSITSANRYVTGTLDPLDLVDERLAEVGTTLIAVGNTAIALGNTGIAIGTTNGLNVIAFGSTGNALGTTILGYGISIYAQGQSNGANLTDVLGRIGTTASSFGSTSVDPGSLYGFLKRAQEFNEGNSSFDKSTGAWQIKTRGSTLLTQKTLADSATTVTKT